MGLGLRNNLSEQPVSFMVDSGGEEQRVGAGTERTIAKAHSPQIGDDNRVAVATGQTADEPPGRMIEHVRSNT